MIRRPAIQIRLVLGSVWRVTHAPTVRQKPERYPLALSVKMLPALMYLRTIASERCPGRH